MARLSGKRRGWRQLALLIAGLVAAIAFSVLLIWPITDLIAAHDVGGVNGAARISQLQAAREAVRTQLLTLGAGFFAAGALAFTWRNFSLARQGQVADRYTRAVEQLGSDKLDVRIGGIYALERVARDSVADHPVVMEVLATFTREHSREPWPPGSADPAVTRATRPDVQAAMTVIGRRTPGRDRDRIDLTGAVLPGAVLFRTDLTRVRLVDANLTGAVLHGADLSQSNLAGVTLTWADLVGARLTGTRLLNADLTSAKLANVDLAGAQLDGAKFPGPDAPPPGWTRAPGTDLLQPDIPPR